MANKAVGKLTTITVASVSLPAKSTKIKDGGTLIEATTFLSSGKYDSEAGVEEANLEFVVLFDPSTTYFGTSAPVMAFGKAITASITYTNNPDSGGATTKTTGFSGRIESVDSDIDVNGIVTLSISAKGSLTSRYS